MLETWIEEILPQIISVLEIFGIFVVTVCTCRAFWHYLRSLVGSSDRYNVKWELASGMATGLEFKMAAEILKTVLVHTVEELMVLGAIILLRALLSLILHLEMRAERNEKKTEP
ncbi:MAG: DUF1622 domain-containing protein [Pygmaiobacter massiliensis]|nr:DUF1622 domain-containing protein [Pygmaiobacter massiliensis]